MVVAVVVGDGFFVLFFLSQNFWLNPEHQMQSNKEKGMLLLLLIWGLSQYKSGTELYLGFVAAMVTFSVSQPSNFL